MTGEIEWAASIADKMANAASAILAKGHNDDAAAQFDTASEIAAAIRGKRPCITGRMPPRYGWKCNCCTTVFTAHQEARLPDDDNGGAKCPHCKAHGQYTYRFDLHVGDPCDNCGTPHDDVMPGPCLGKEGALIAALREIEGHPSAGIASNGYRSCRQIAASAIKGAEHVSAR
jgi:hypothetical protein